MTKEQEKILVKIYKLARKSSGMKFKYSLITTSDVIYFDLDVNNSNYYDSFEFFAADVDLQCRSDWGICYMI